MAPTNFEKTTQDRGVIEELLDFLESRITAHQATPITKFQADALLDRAIKAEEAVMTNYQALTHAAPKDTDMTSHKKQYQEMLERSISAHAALHGIVQSFPEPTSKPPCQSIKLPPLELPKFSGNLQDWVSFRDLYTTAIHNSSLTKVEKLTQLKSLLVGEAARQIRSLVLSDANYDIAWTSLKERYENNHELLFTLLRRLFNQGQVTPNSAASIRGLIDTSKECVRSLDVLSLPTQHWDAILLYLISTKLDTTTRELWEQSLTTTSIPKLSQLYDFLEQRSRALAASSGIHSKPRNNKKRVSSHHATSSKCKLGCNNYHPFYKCPEFRNLTPQQRKDTTIKFKLCLNCLHPGHNSSECKSTQTCKTCNNKHHTLLHNDSRSSTSQSAQAPGTSSSVSTFSTHLQGEIQTAPLATARVLISNTKGYSTSARAFIDPGSSVDFVTEKLVQKLRLPLYNTCTSVTGLAENPVGTCKHTTKLTIKPHFSSDVSYTITALVVKKITGPLPVDKFDSQIVNQYKHLHLADPNYYVPSPVDLLIGSSIFWDALQDGQMKGNPNEPVATNSSFGWLIAGRSWSTQQVTTFITNIDLDTTLRRFWETEELATKHLLTPEENKCEAHFEDHYSRDETGRFTVSIPWKDELQNLGESRTQATKRFHALERRFKTQGNYTNNPTSTNSNILQQKWRTYQEFMDEYETLGHMSPVPEEEVSTPNGPVYYIPHHCVEKSSSTTTKLRVVFDASANTTTGLSLNSCMMVGPQLQDKLLDIMVRFRLHPIAFTADLEKMYRQIRVKPADSDLQRILWRKSCAEPIKEYRLNTVTYGTASAPYLAIKCLRTLAEEERHRYPDAAIIALRDFYVDDLASGTRTTESAKQLVNQLIQLTASGCFQLRKWVTNDQTLLRSIPQELRETKSIIPLSHDDSVTVKTLGIMWDTATDTYQFSIDPTSFTSQVYTKKLVLSEIARIYDPCGWLAPVIIKFKIFMQTLWKLNIDWETPLPEEVNNHWTSLKTSLPLLQQLKIPRCVSPGHPVSQSLLCFADASEKAYAAVIYVHNKYEDTSTTTRLLTSKTRVAPVKSITLARLELNAAGLLAELINNVTTALQLEFAEIRAYTDSMITYHWINSSPLRWKTYVRNRVNSILTNAPNAKWYHVRGTDNPADCASRGITPSELLNHAIWWNGPSQTPSEVAEVYMSESELAAVQSEVKQVGMHVQVLKPLHNFFYSYSSFLRLQRIAAWILRFASNCQRKKSKEPLLSSHLTTTELSSCHNKIIAALQQTSFPHEFHVLSKKEAISGKSKLYNLSPFISAEGLIRVGGRLHHAEINFNKKHPILLPRHHHVVNSIITDTHRLYLHAGPQSTLTILQQRYWILRGKDAVNFALKKCLTCFRAKATTMNQFMGNLPAARVNPSRPFSKVGIDYAGPFTTRLPGRSKVTVKSWLAIFICFTTHAMHIEVVSSLSTDSFIAALKRFCSRRGYPSDIYSDCGTNFKGADKVLRDFVRVCNTTAVHEISTTRAIQWHFIPPGSPHFGGLWEAGVRSVKYHLTRVMVSTLLTYEELSTLVTQIEAILNSRPLVPASSDPSDLEVLTPAHFLIGSSLLSPPEPSTLDLNIGRLDRFQRIQHQREQFWKRWSGEYITRLQQRPKWQGTTRNIKIGDMVIVKDERLPPQRWKLGRVTATHNGSDGLCRVATIHTADGDLTRAIAKLCLLPFNSD